VRHRLVERAWSGLALLLLACPAADQPPRQSEEMLEAQAELATDPSQAEAWKEAAARPAELPEPPGEGQVTVRKPAAVSDRASTPRPQPFPADLPAAAVLVSAPELPEGFAGPMTVEAVDGEYLTLDLGQDRLLRLHAKVRGRPLQARPGETGRLVFRSTGDPFHRDDTLEIDLPAEEFFQVVAGGDRPVRVEVRSFKLSAAQTEPAERGGMPVQIRAGNVVRTLRAGEETDVAGGLTVRVVASVAASEEAAAVLPERYRLELIGWRSRGVE